MNPDIANMKKRKLFAAARDLGLPPSKHKCCEGPVCSEYDSFFMKALNSDDVEVLDTQVASAQDSNSFPGDSQLSAEVTLEEGFRKTDSYDEASTSWTNSGLGKSGNGFSLESRIWSGTEDGVEEHYAHQETRWHDIDHLEEECIRAECCKDSEQQTAKGLEEFLSSSGVNTNLFVLSSERWSIDQEAQMGRRKPTIDQEFEQYFSTLML